MKVILSTSTGCQRPFLPVVGCVSQCLEDQDLKGEMSPPVQGQAPRERAIELLIRTSLRLCGGWGGVGGVVPLDSLSQHKWE